MPRYRDTRLDYPDTNLQAMASLFHEAYPGHRLYNAWEAGDMLTVHILRYVSLTEPEIAATFRSSEEALITWLDAKGLVCRVDIPRYAFETIAYWDDTQWHKDVRP